MNKEKLLLIGLLIIFSFSIFASQAKIDSLESQLINSKGEERIKILAELVWTSIENKSYYDFNERLDNLQNIFSLKKFHFINLVNSQES